MSHTRFQILKAAHVIRNGGVIAYPTESVYGLGCDPLSESAVNKILQMKKRPVDKGLIIIACNLDQLRPYIDITSEQETKILTQSSPMTWIVKKSPATPAWISGNHRSIAIRISQHPVVVELCQLLKQPIVSTSANPSHKTPATTSSQSRQYFRNYVDFYLNSATGNLQKPTPITDIESDTLVRN